MNITAYLSIPIDDNCNILNSVRQYPDLVLVEYLKNDRNIQKTYPAPYDDIAVEYPDLHRNRQQHMRESFI